MDFERRQEMMERALEQRVHEYAAGTDFPNLAMEWRGSVDSGELARNAREEERIAVDPYAQAALRFLADRYPKIFETTARGEIQPKYDIKHANPSGASVLLGLPGGIRFAVRQYIEQESAKRPPEIRSLHKDRMVEFRRLMTLPYAADPVSSQRTVGERLPHAACTLTRKEIQQLASAALYNEEPSRELIERITREIAQSLEFNENLLTDPVQKSQTQRVATTVRTQLAKMSERTKIS